MAKFINKDHAISITCATWATGKYAKENANEHFIRGLETYKEWLENLPVADVAEVKHGYWIDTTAYCGEFTCSICKETCVTNKYKYCPHCGAKMDLEEKSK